MSTRWRQRRRNQTSTVESRGRPRDRSGPSVRPELWIHVGAGAQTSHASQTSAPPPRRWFAGTSRHCFFSSSCTSAQQTVAAGPEQGAQCPVKWAALRMVYCHHRGPIRLASSKFIGCGPPVADICRGWTRCFLRPLIFKYKRSKLYSASCEMTRFRECSPHPPPLKVTKFEKYSTFCSGKNKKKHEHKSVKGGLDAL